MRPYREAEAKLAKDVPDRLECSLQDGDRGRWVRAMWVKATFVLMGCTWVTTAHAPLASIPIVLAGLLWMRRDFLDRKGATVTFAVDHGRVSLERAEGSRSFELEALHDVRLDTKSTSKNLTVARADGVNTVFGAPSPHDIELDVSRIELVFEDGEELLLSKEWISHSLTTETLRSIRLFLRAHGWRPFDERGP